MHSMSPGFKAIRYTNIEKDYPSRTSTCPASWHRFRAIDREIMGEPASAVLQNIPTGVLRYSGTMSGREQSVMQAMSRVRETAHACASSTTNPFSRSEVSKGRITRPAAGDCNSAGMLAPSKRGIYRGLFPGQHSTWDENNHNESSRQRRNMLAAA